MTQSPVAGVLEALGLTALEAAVLGGVSPAAISQAKAGGRIPLGLRMALEKAGIDAAALEAAQSEFRAQQSEALKERVANRGGQIPTRCVAAAAVTK